MKRKEFIKGSAIIGASVVMPNVLKAASGLIGEEGRRVYRVLSADKTMVGTLPVLRAFAGDHNDHVSPYVFFDEFGPVRVDPKAAPLRVDAHPHAGTKTERRRRQDTWLPDMAEHAIEGQICRACHRSFPAWKDGRDQREEILG